MVSNPRINSRGGGVCFVADLTKVDIQPLDIPNPNYLEIVFAIVTPKNEGIIKKSITFALYSPPRSKRKSKMTDLDVTTLYSLLTVYPETGLMGGGNRNCYDVSPIIAAVPGLQNLQQQPTLGRMNLDIFPSNMRRFYAMPIIVLSVKCDNPLKGVPSDHSVPIIYLVSNSTIYKQKEYTYRMTRPLPDSGVREFVKLIVECLIHWTAACLGASRHSHTGHGTAKTVIEAAPESRALCVFSLTGLVFISTHRGLN